MDDSGHFIARVYDEETADIVRNIVLFLFCWFVICLAFNLFGGH
jgi:hypothetical protein